jgi:tRNA/tmRNA/rRNA uracil-C5-methylase (TrmA/RlmC/RlmD family)
MTKNNEEKGDLQDAVTAAQLEKIKLEVEGLRRNKKEGRLVRYLPLLTALVAVAAFLSGVYQFKTLQNERLRAEKITSDREFKKALWEKQRDFYLEAARAASTLASFNENAEKDILAERTRAQVRFWQLYYGELAVIEDPKVSKAMVDYGRCLRAYEFGNCSQSDLKQHARALAQEFRDAISRAWDEPLGRTERP